MKLGGPGHLAPAGRIGKTGPVMPVFGTNLLGQQADALRLGKHMSEFVMTIGGDTVLATGSFGVVNPAQG